MRIYLRFFDTFVTGLEGEVLAIEISARDRFNAEWGSMASEWASDAAVLPRPRD
jgi:hypothetical protein